MKRSAGMAEVYQQARFTVNAPHSRCGDSYLSDLRTLSVIGWRNLAGLSQVIDTTLPRKFDQHDWEGRLAEFLDDPGDRNALAALPQREIRELERILVDVPHVRHPANAALWGRERGLWLNHIPLDVLRLETSLWEHVAVIEDTFSIPQLTTGLHLWWARGTLGEDNIPPVDWAAEAKSNAYVKIIEGDHKSIISSPDLHASVRDVLSGLNA